MAFKIILVAFCAVLGVVTGEPPSGTYGTPLAPPLNSYGTPNYDIGGGDHGGQGGHGGQGDHGDHGDHGEPSAEIARSPMSYEFGYQVKDEYSGNNYNRKEASDGNQVRGEYRVQLPDGRTQIVTYYADWQTGFHADVRYEGTAQYPDQYNTYQGGYNGGSNYQGGSNFGAGGPATSAVSIKDYSSGGSSGYNGGNSYDSYAGNYANKGRPAYEYGAP